MDLFEGGEEDLLGDVVCIMRPGEKAVDEARDGLLVSGDEVIEGVGVAACEAIEERLVGERRARSVGEISDVCRHCHIGLLLAINLTLGEGVGPRLSVVRGCKPRRLEGRKR